MLLLNSLSELRNYRQSAEGPVALVATMGALHPGHLRHIDEAVKHAKTVIVSIFVNPTQFGPNEDFEKYPRRLEDDAKLCEERGASAIFCPSVGVMYPEGVLESVVDVPTVTSQAGMEDRFRPGHFRGVCRVVAKLFNMVQPDLATFGRKDLQQLRLIQAMIADLAMPIETIEIPIVRESDGLAMSSRNRYLSPEERERALGIHRALDQAQELIAQAHSNGVASIPALEVQQFIVQTLEAHALEIDYAEVRDDRTLSPVSAVIPGQSNVSGIITARLGQTRLLDNQCLNPA